MISEREKDFGLAFRAESMGDRRACVFQNGSLTYRELVRQAEGCAAHLRETGCGPGDAVFLFMQNRAELPVLFFAAASLGLQIVLVNPLYRERELQQLLTSFTPKAIFTDSGYLTTISGFQRGSAFYLDLSKEPERFRAMTETGGAAPEPGRMMEAESVVCTSGSTGRIKFVVRKLENQLIPARSIAGSLRLTEEDRLYVPIPLSQQYGLIAVLIGLLSGAEIHVTDRFYADRALSLIEEQGITVQFGVPALYIKEQRAYEEMEKKPDLSGLRAGMISGAPCPASLIRWYDEVLHCRLLNSYGTTEIAAVTMCDLDDDEEVRYGTCGRPFDYLKLRTVDEHGKQTGAGIPGEVLCKTPCLMEGYAFEPDLTAAVLDGNRCLKTGDIGCIREDGRLVFVGRKKDMIVHSGYNVFPAEVERMLLESGYVDEACVVGKEDELSGESLVAFVKRRDGAVTEEFLRRYSKERLARYKVPGRIVFVDELPRLQNEKYDYLTLRARAAEL